MLETPLSRLLNIRVPLLQGGMSWVSRHGLASAVSEAGALGVLGAATMEPEELRAEIVAVRERTERPFGVNIPLVCVRPDGSDVVEALIEVAIDELVPVVITGAGSAARFTEVLQGAGSTVLHVVPSPALARKAYDAGVDAVIAESYEAGGHVREGGLATFSLVPQVVDAVPCPVVAAGGISDARGVLAAFGLGAHGVQMGTRFIATSECEAHRSYKQAVLDAAAEDGVVYSRAYHASRGLATPIVRAIIELEARGADVAEVRALRGRHRARVGCVEGDLDEGICPAGSAVGMVCEIVSAGKLVEQLMLEVREQLVGLGRMFDGERCGS